MGKVKYCAEPKNAARSCKAAGVDLPTHYKNMYNCAKAVQGMELSKAFTYLDAVLEKKRVIPFRRYVGGVGRRRASRCWSACSRMRRRMRNRRISIPTSLSS